jgi:hypothetical protein
VALRALTDTTVGVRIHGMMGGFEACIIGWRGKNILPFMPSLSWRGLAQVGDGLAYWNGAQ